MYIFLNQRIISIIHSNFLLIAWEKWIIILVRKLCRKQLESHWSLSAGHHPWLIRPLGSLLYGSEAQKRTKHSELKAVPDRFTPSSRFWEIYTENLLSYLRTGCMCWTSKMFTFFSSFLPDPARKKRACWKKRVQTQSSFKTVMNFQG